MFIISLKTNIKRTVLWILIIIVILLILSTIIFACVKNNNKDIKTAKYLNSNTQRIEYLKSFGWEVEEEACEIIEVIIPNEFNDVYNNYNKIQKLQGFNLEEYKGKAVKRYTYKVLNYPGKPENIRANILLYGNKIIGGDICSIELDGFMHGFAMKKTK